MAERWAALGGGAPFLATAILALTMGCTGAGFTPSACRTVSRTPDGDLASDVIGTWEGFGIDSRLVYVFEEGGDFRFVEPPNRYAPSGLEDEGSWSVLAADELSVTWSGGGATTWIAEVTEAHLLLTNASAFDDGSEPWTDTWSRVCCTGSPKPCF
ncbi:MAG: hypothetical protein QGH45_22595 [Myxococcota bacterium]|jgi:hypothetical protein|nr:hypothetical protein [Myxococcota bacterium]